MAIIDSVPVAIIQLGSRTEPPYGELNEAREASREIGVERPRVDPLRQTADDVGAAARCVAPRPVWVLGSKAAKRSGPVQVIVQERVDHDHRRAGRHPSLAVRVGGEQQVSKRHRPDFLAYAVDLAQGGQERRAHTDGSVGCVEAGIGVSEPPIEPGNQVAVADVAQKQRE